MIAEFMAAKKVEDYELILDNRIVLRHALAKELPTSIKGMDTIENVTIVQRCDHKVSTWCLYRPGHILTTVYWAYCDRVKTFWYRTVQA